MVHVSEIHAAGGLDKWVRKQAANADIPHDVQRRATKTAKVIDDMASAKCEARKRNHDAPTEHNEQVEFIKWAEQNVKSEIFDMLFAIPNGGLRHKKTAADLKAEGCKKGIPDICLAVPRGKYHGLYIEMKRTIGGSVSAEQAEMIGKLKDNGYMAFVAKGALAAVHILQTYLEQEDWK